MTHQHLEHGIGQIKHVYDKDRIQGDRCNHWSYSTNVEKHNDNVHKPLGGECGKSRDNNNFMRKTPFSYGVPAARETMFIQYEVISKASKV